MMDHKVKSAKELDAELLLGMFERWSANRDPRYTEDYNVLKAEIMRRLEFYDKVVEAMNR